MAAHTSPILHIHIAIFCDICASQCIICQHIRLVDMTTHASPVFHVYTAVTCNITKQANLHILRHILRTHRDGILPCNMVLLHHLHGVGAGENACDGVACSVTLDNSLIRSFGRTAFGELNNHFIGIAVKARCRAENGVAHDLRLGEGIDALGRGGVDGHFKVIDLEGKGLVVQPPHALGNGKLEVNAVGLAAEELTVRREAVFRRAFLVLVQLAVSVCINEPCESADVNAVVDDLLALAGAGHARDDGVGRDGGLLARDGRGHRDGGGVIRGLSVRNDVVGGSQLAGRVAEELVAVHIVIHIGLRERAVVRGMEQLHLVAVDDERGVGLEVILRAVCRNARRDDQLADVSARLVALAHEVGVGARIAAVIEHVIPRAGIIEAGRAVLVGIQHRRVGRARARHVGNLGDLALAREHGVAARGEDILNGVDADIQHIIAVVRGERAAVAGVALHGLIGGEEDGVQIDRAAGGVLQAGLLVGVVQRCVGGRDVRAVIVLAALLTALENGAVEGAVAGDAALDDLAVGLLVPGIAAGV